MGSFLANRLMHVIARRIHLARFLPLGAAIVTGSTVLMFLAPDTFWEILPGAVRAGGDDDRDASHAQHRGSEGDSDQPCLRGRGITPRR